MILYWTDKQCYKRGTFDNYPYRKKILWLFGILPIYIARIDNWTKEKQ